MSYFWCNVCLTCDGHGECLDIDGDDKGEHDDDDGHQHPTHRHLGGAAPPLALYPTAPSLFTSKNGPKHELYHWYNVNGSVAINLGAYTKKKSMIFRPETALRSDTGLGAHNCLKKSL